MKQFEEYYMKKSLAYKILEKHLVEGEMIKG